MPVRARFFPLVLASPSAFAQGNSAATGPSMSQQDPCRHQVSDGYCGLAKYLKDHKLVD